MWGATWSCVLDHHPAGPESSLRGSCQSYQSRSLESVALTRRGYEADELDSYAVLHHHFSQSVLASVGFERLQAQQNIPDKAHLYIVTSKAAKKASGAQTVCSKIGTGTGTVDPQLLIRLLSVKHVTTQKRVHTAPTSSSRFSSTGLISTKESRCCAIQDMA